MDNNNNLKMWKSDIKDWTKLDLHAADFYISQAEKRLKETNDTYNISSVRTNSYLNVTITLLSICLGYIFTGSIMYLKTVSFFAIIPLLFSVYYLWQNLKSNTIYTSGDVPKAIFTSKFVDEHTGTEQYLALTKYTMETIQYKIEQNRIVNLCRIKNNKYIRIAIILTPIIALVGATIYLHFFDFHLAWICQYQ